MAKKRTVMKSKAGKKLYAVRDESGEFTDIQTYERAQSADMRQKSAAELEQAAKAQPKKTVKKPAKKKTAKKSATKKSATKKSAKKAKSKPAKKKAKRRK